MRAINDVVIIERDSYQGRLIVSSEKMCHGVVLSVGPGCYSSSIHEVDPITGESPERWRSTMLKPGDRVAFSLDKGEEHTIEGKRVVVMKESHVAAILDDEEAA